MLVAVALSGVAGRGRECGLPLAHWGAIQTKVLSAQVAAEVREACRRFGAQMQREQGSPLFVFSCFLTPAGGLPDSLAAPKLIKVNCGCRGEVCTGWYSKNCQSFVSSGRKHRCRGAGGPCWCGSVV